MAHGLIVAIKKNLSPDEFVALINDNNYQKFTSRDIDILYPPRGTVLTPGLVDQHSHAGADSYPGYNIKLLSSLYFN